MNPSKGTTIILEERIKTVCQVWDFVTPVGTGEKRNPTDWVGCSVIAARFKEHTVWKRAWLGTAITLVNFGRIYLGRNFGVTYSAYKEGCGKQFRLETSAKRSIYRNLS